MDHPINHKTKNNLNKEKLLTNRLSLSLLADLKDPFSFSIEKTVKEFRLNQKDAFSSIINTKFWDCGNLTFFLLKLMFKPTIVLSNHKVIPETMQTMNKTNNYLAPLQIESIVDLIDSMMVFDKLNFDCKNYKGQTPFVYLQSLIDEMTFDRAEPNYVYVQALNCLNLLVDDYIEMQLMDHLGQKVNKNKLYEPNSMYDLIVNKIDEDGFDRSVKDAVSLLFD